MKAIIIHEVLHEGMKPPRLADDLLKVIEGREYDLVASLHEADGCQQLEDKRLRPQGVVDEGECDAVDRFTMLDYHVEAVLKISEKFITIFMETEIRNFKTDNLLQIRNLNIKNCLC